MDGSPDRDHAVERLLRRSLQAPRADLASASCLDAETVAAWVEGGLSGAALEAAEVHVADCARCQALVGALARIEAAAPPRPEPAGRRWFAWLVPLTAAATAVALWVAVPREREARVTEVGETAQQGRLENDRALPDGQLPAGSAPPASPSSSAERPAFAPEPQLEARRDAKQLDADSRLKKEAELAPPAAAAPPEAAAAVAAPAPPAPAAPAASADERVAATPSSARNAFDRARAAAPDIVSPDPAVRWRLSGSDVLHSADGGTTWEAAPAPSITELTAGSAPSTSVCWVVGRGGVVLVTTDGRTWRRVAFPEATDLTAVRARDGRSASVTTADGRPFSTTDGGVTWVPRPLQGF